jgi:RHS repeat-associated protein
MVTPTDQTYCYHFNAIGSTIATTDQNQNIMNAYSYDAFGNVVAQTEVQPQPFKFVAQHGVMTESNGFYYMRARYYDPNVGRFISEDPIGFEGGINLYSYTANNPINFIDPSGLLINWGNYIIHNSHVRENLINLNQQIVNSGIPNTQFTLRGTGGDRYRDDNGGIRSATDNSVVRDSARNSPHILERGARAVDLQVVGVNDDVFDSALGNTAFSPRDTLRNYTDGHTHINLPNQQRYYWDAPTGGCNR